jgi:hypothetical protein
MADKEVEVDEDMDVAMACPHLLRAVHPLSHDYYGREDTSVTGNTPGNR